MLDGICGIRLIRRSIVFELLENGKVKPVMFDQVTIYFSDIVGFTRISFDSSAQEVRKNEGGNYSCGACSEQHKMATEMA